MDPLIETTTQSLPHRNWPMPDYLDHFSSELFKRALHYISARDLDNTKLLLELLNDGNIELQENELFLLISEAFSVENNVIINWLANKDYIGLGIYDSVSKFVTDRRNMVMIMTGSAIRNNDIKLFEKLLNNQNVMEQLSDFDDLFINNVMAGIKNNDPSLLDWYEYINNPDSDAIVIAAIENKAKSPIWKKLKEIGFELPNNPLKLLDIDDRLFDIVANKYKKWMIENHGLLSDEQIGILINNCVWWEELKIGDGILKQSVDKFSNANYREKITMMRSVKWRVEETAFSIILEKTQSNILNDLKKFILTNDTNLDNIRACYVLIDASKDVELQILEWAIVNPNEITEFIFRMMRTTFEDGEYEHLFKDTELLSRFKDINTKNFIGRSEAYIALKNPSFFDNYIQLGVSIDVAYIDKMIEFNNISFIERFSKIADPTVWTTYRHRFLLAAVDKPDIADLIDKLSAAVDFESVYELPTAVNRANRIVGHILSISGDLNRPFEISLFDEPAPPAIVSSEFINHSPSIRQNDALPQPVAHRVQESSGRIRFRFGTPVIDADTPFIRVIPSQLQPVTIISQIEVPEQPVVVPRITQPML